MGVSLQHSQTNLEVLGSNIMEHAMSNRSLGEDTLEELCHKCSIHRSAEALRDDGREEIIYLTSLQQTLLGCDQIQPTQGITQVELPRPTKGANPSALGLDVQLVKEETIGVILSAS